MFFFARCELIISYSTDVPTIQDANVKLEPRDQLQQRLSPCLPNFGPYRDPVMTTPSPQPNLSPSPLTINNLMPNLQMNYFVPNPPQQQQQQNSFMNNFNYIPNITTSIAAPTTSLMDQPTTSYTPSLMMVNHQQNGMSGGTTSTAYQDLGLMSRPNATQVPSINSDQFMFSNISADLMNIDNLSGDLKGLSFSDLLKNDKDNWIVCVNQTRKFAITT